MAIQMQSKARVCCTSSAPLISPDQIVLKRHNGVLPASRAASTPEAKPLLQTLHAICKACEPGCMHAHSVVGTSCGGGEGGGKRGRAWKARK